MWGLLSLACLVWLYCRLSDPPPPSQNFSFKPRLFTKKRKKKKKSQQVEPSVPPVSEASSPPAKIASHELLAMLKTDGAASLGSAEKAEVWM